MRKSHSECARSDSITRPVGPHQFFATQRTAVTHSRSRSSAGYSALLKRPTGRGVTLTTDETGRTCKRGPDGQVSPNRLRNRKWPVGSEMCFSQSTFKLWCNSRHSPDSLMLARLASGFLDRAPSLKSKPMWKCLNVKHSPKYNQGFSVNVYESKLRVKA